MIHQERSGLRIVVLAAGFSTRMGRPKALLTVRGESLIRRTIAVLTPFAANNIVVITSPRATRLRAELRGYRVTVLPNPQRARGLSSSIVRALRETRYSRATLLLPADLGQLESRDMARLISRWRSSKRRVTARRADGRALTPLILPKWLYARARSLAGDMGLRALVAALPKEQCVSMDLPSADRDVDTPQELAAARRARTR